MKGSSDIAADYFGYFLYKELNLDTPKVRIIRYNENHFFPIIKKLLSATINND